MPDETVDFYPSRAHVLLLALAAFALVVLCGAATRVGFESAQATGSPAALAAVSISVTGVFVFTGLGLLVVRRLLLPTWPVLTLDHDGLTDWLPNLGVEQVLWSEVTGIRETRLAFRRVLAVDVADPKAVAARQRTVVRRIAASAHTAIVGTPVVLKPGSVDARLEELAAALGEFVAGRTPGPAPVTPDPVTSGVVTSDQVAPSPVA